MQTRISWIILLLVFQVRTSANTDTIPHLYEGFQASYGFIIPHSVVIRPVSYSNPYGFEISLNKLNVNYERWQIFNAYWIAGIQAGFVNFQNPEVIGSVFAITASAEPVIAFGKKFLLTIRAGAGVSYHTKAYDEITNPTNQFFATKINFPLYVNIRMKQRLGNHIFVTLSGCYNHISNGGFKQPNKGINFPTLAAGIEYFHRDIPELKREYSSDLEVPKPGIFWLIQALSTFQILSKTDIYPETRVFTFGFHTRIAKQVTRFYALNIGGEMIFDGYIKETIRREQTSLDYKRFAFTAGQDFMFGKVFFSQLLGVYIYSPYKARHPVYQKYELAYRISPRLMTGVYLKAHLQVAEMMGFSCSLLFGK